MHTLDPGLLSTKIHTRESPGILVHELMIKSRSAGGPMRPEPSLLQHTLHDLPDIFKQHTAQGSPCHSLGAKQHLSRLSWFDGVSRPLIE